MKVVFVSLSLIFLLLDPAQGQVLGGKVKSGGNSTVIDTSTCPVDPASSTKLNFSGIEAACATTSGPTQAFCTSCLCGLVEVYMPAFEKAGLISAIANGGTLPTNAASQLISVCSSVFLAPLLASGVDLTGLTNLPNCNFDKATVPPCVEEKFRARVEATTGSTPKTSAPSEDILPDTNLTTDVKDAAGPPVIEAENGPIDGPVGMEPPMSAKAPDMAEPPMATDLPGMAEPPIAAGPPTKYPLFKSTPPVAVVEEGEGAPVPADVVPDLPPVVTGNAGPTEPAGSITASPQARSGSAQTVPAVFSVVCALASAVLLATFLHQ